MMKPVRKSLKTYKPWITEEIIEMINERKKYKNSNSVMALYRKFRNQVYRESTKVKRNALRIKVRKQMKILKEGTQKKLTQQQENSLGNTATGAVT